MRLLRRLLLMWQRTKRLRKRLTLLMLLMLQRLLQRLLQQLLGLPEPAYAHVPLVLAPDGTRLAKRHGAVTLADLAARGIGPERVLARLGWSLGLCARDDTVTAIELADGFRLDSVPRTPWSLTATEL